jgi:hypothetical protein
VLVLRVAVSATLTTAGLLAPGGRRQAELDRLAAAGLCGPADAPVRAHAATSG